MSKPIYSVTFFFLLCSFCPDCRLVGSIWAETDPAIQGTLYVVGYAHLDTQWRWDYKRTIEEYLPNTLRQNFSRFASFPDYVFNFSGAHRYMLMKEYYPEDYEVLKTYVKQGRWHVAGSSVDEGDVLVPSPESIFRQILYGNGYFRQEFGEQSEDYLLPDCFGFPASLPSILAHSGLNGVSTQKLTWGSAVGIPFNVGNWKGPDGRSIIAALNPGKYGGSLEEGLENSSYWLGRINQLGAQSGLFVDYRYYGVGDRGGAARTDDVKRLESALSANGAIKVVAASADQMFQDLSTKDTSRLPVYRGDLLLTEHSAGSLTSQSYMKRLNRKNELLADAAERAATAAMWLGGSQYPQQKLNASWIRVLANQMHDILAGTSIPKAYEYSWNDEIVALNGFSAVIENAVGTVARALNTVVSGTAVVVFNPLSIERQDVVEAEIPLSAANVAVFGPDGQEVPAQIIKGAAGVVTVLFPAKVPSVGFAVYDVRATGEFSPAAHSGASANGLRLENSRYAVTLNKAGDLASIIDKKAGSLELLSEPVRLVFQHEQPSKCPAWNMDWKDRKLPPYGAVDGPAVISVEEAGPVRATIRVERQKLGSVFVQYIRLAQGSNRIEIDSRIDWKTPGSSLKATFPLAVKNRLATYNWELGTIRRGNNRPRQYEVPSHQWFDLTDESGQYGVAILDDSKYGSDKPNDNTVRLTLLYTPTARTYVDQNTQDFGKHRIVYAIVGHAKDWRDGNIQWEAARLNQPLVTFRTDSHPGILGKTFSLVKVIPARQVAVRAIKKAEDSDRIIIRLQELFGKRVRKVRLTIGNGVSSAEETDGQERPIGEATVDQGDLVFGLLANSPKTFAVSLKGATSTLSTPVCEPLSLSYDRNAVSFHNASGSDADMDGSGTSLPGELLPATLVSEDILFQLGPTGGDSKNVLVPRGQRLKLPEGNYNRLYLLAASVQGDQDATFRIDGTPVQLKVQDWSGYVGQWYKRVWSTSDAKTLEKIVPGFIKRENIAWFSTHRHLPGGRDEAYKFSYLFKYRINVPQKAGVLRLPNNDKIRVFAITLASNANDVAEKAQLLYEDFE